MKRELLRFMSGLTMFFIVGSAIVVGVLVAMAFNVFFGLLAAAGTLVVVGLPSGIFLALMQILETLEEKKEIKIDHSIS